MNIFKLHLNVIKFLREELKKKRTLKQFIYFMQDVIIQYFKILLHQYKNLFNLLDKKYREQVKQYKKYQKLQNELRLSLKLLEYFDKHLEQQGKNRQQIRQFWCDFTKYRQVRKEVIEKLMKELN